MDWRNSYPIFLLLALVSVNRAAPLPIPQYKVGDTAVVDILTPVHLIVIDHARTEQLRQQEAQRTPAIYWFYPDEIDEAEANLRSAIDSRRENFLNLLEASYARRNLNDVAVALPRFQRLVGSFQKQSNAFPVSASLAEVWALGASDDYIRTNLAGKLRQAMEHHIEADSLPPEGKIGPLKVKMLTGKLKEAGLDLAQIEKQAMNFFLTDMVFLAQASKEVQSTFAPEERGWGEFLATLVRENCAWDAELTRKSRKAKTDSIWAADEYEPGQLVVKRGDLIDARIKAVLDQLRERAAGEQARKDLVKGQSEAETAVARFHEQAVRAQTSAQITAEQNRWLLGGLAGAFVALLFVIWRLARWKRSNSLLPAKCAITRLPGP